MIIFTATDKQWEMIKNQNQFVSLSLEKEGFIHCCYPHQILWVLNRHFIKEKRVMLICINENKLMSKWKSEDLSQRGQDFPHVYGPINKDAVIDHFWIESDFEGIYQKNEKLSQLVDIKNNI